MENKKTKIISIIAIIALILTVITATYAYFQAQTGEGSQADVKINANTVDTLTFETGSAISLSLDQTSFAQGTGNKTGNTFAKAMLTANNKTNSATDHYYLYLNISSNSFIYSIDENTPEILLTIKDGSNDEITSISGLTYTSVTDASGATISGFDITTKNGLITIFDNRQITTTSSKTENWNVTITYVNYDADQSKNASKSFDAKLEIQKDKYKQTLAEYVIAQFTGTQGENGIYYHDSTLANGAEDNSYRYAGGDYQVTNKAITSGLNYVMTNNSSATDGVVNMYCNGVKQYVGFPCNSTKYYTLQYNTSNTQYTTYSNVLSKALSDGYISRNNIKNFVCFGTNDSACSEDDLYRIIGVFGNQVKLIKATIATSNILGTNGGYSTDTSYTWSNLTSCPSDTTAYKKNNNIIRLANKDILAVPEFTGCNIWSESELNKINLNTNFINNLESEWANMIADSIWKVSGYSSSDVTPKEMYIGEITNATKTYGPNDGVSKIGLMYASEYGFAASSNAWSLSLNNYNNLLAKNNNWLYDSLENLVLTPISVGDNTIFLLYQDGVIETLFDMNIRSKNVRPSFYLKNSVTYSSGDGTISNPIRIN